jgi:hypothetical protein
MTRKKVRVSISGWIHAECSEVTSDKELPQVQEN